MCVLLNVFKIHRFQRAENAKVDVIHFALKGYGLRAMDPLRP
jgi:hypothetical protein